MVFTTSGANYPRVLNGEPFASFRAYGPGQVTVDSNFHLTACQSYFIVAPTAPAKA